MVTALPLSLAGVQWIKKMVVLLNLSLKKYKKVMMALRFEHAVHFTGLVKICMLFWPDVTGIMSHLIVHVSEPICKFSVFMMVGKLGLLLALNWRAI